MLEPEERSSDCDCSIIDSRRTRLSDPNANLQKQQNACRGLLHDSGNGASLWLQGLQTSRRRPSTRKVVQGSPGGKGFDRLGVSGMCGMSRRMRIRTQCAGRRQAYQQRARSRSGHASSGNFSRRINRNLSTRLLFTVAVAGLVLACLVQRVQGFGAGFVGVGVVGGDCRRVRPAVATCRMVMDDSEEVEKEEEIGEDLDTGGVLLDDLSWRVAKLRLEEENKKRFLKARPRFLPYEHCKRWVQAWGSRWETEEDWNSWISMGEKRNAYIPSRPDEYYGRLGQWISWEHFLGTDGEGETKEDQQES